ncbi:XRE family transcriptional regulator [Actinomadura sp. GC306]|uniref:helix-turn-helix domain-containing protein n=1 Tax=Actinomadura sp. GC306 TaxID=2530367 RepID=UPI001044B90F|nr:helix-turn-helix transcriptional regulator [Actinomadura sp. GC306]TDC70171.1 XRE family transcriptional regulator [Actinomadura sp. GC306]
MTFGERLRQLMAERGISQRRLAKLVPCNDGYLSKLARNLQVPSAEMAAQLDEALDAGGQLAALRTPPAVGRRVTVHGKYADEVAVTASGIGHHGPVAPELVGYFRQQLPGHYRADMWLGPHMLIPTVNAQTRLIQQLLRTADTPVRRGLLEMGVAYAALLGWLHQDAADLDQSEHWRTAALDMAHRHGDPELVGYALANKAMHAVDLRDGAAVIDYAHAALADEGRLSPKVRVLALVYLAHGYGYSGDRDAVDRVLDRAESLVDRVDDAHPWGNACRRTPRYMDIQRATAYGRAGAHADAVRLWDEILVDQPADYRRDTGVFRARQAAALAAAPDPEPEKVVEIAEGAADACTQTGSERLRGELAALPTHASAWAHSPHGRELVEIIASVT